MNSLNTFFQGKKTYIVGALGILAVWFGYLAGYDFTGTEAHVTFSGAVSASVVIITQLVQKVGSNRTEKKVDAIVQATPGA